MRVENMISSSGNSIANQFIIEDDDGNRFFQSYGSIIIKDTGAEIFLDQKYWEYSVTTGKYRNQFLGEQKKETQRKLDAGIYKLANLNFN